MKNKKRLIVDLDNTITVTEHGDYVNSKPVQPTIDALKKYREDGFEIVIFSSRNMRTYEANVGKINIYTLPNIISWLNNHDVPYDEIFVGKPWCGFEGFYIDDCAVRPSEFHRMSFEEITEMLETEKEYIKSLI
ncbi:MAG: HAD-IIIC family phosphatase [Prevotellaceae bacterium]|nr:HAD-IIIC family phosphatase [Candidatus Faecinaster equi]